MKISTFIITLLLVSGIIVSIYGFANDLGSTQHLNVEINDSYKNTYNKITELQNITTTTQDRIQNITSKEDKNFFTGTWDVFKVTKEITFGAAKTTTTGLTVGTTLITDFINDLSGDGESAYISTIIITILTILVLGALIFLIIKRTW